MADGRLDLVPYEAAGLGALGGDLIVPEPPALTLETKIPEYLGRADMRKQSPFWREGFNRAYWEALEQDQRDGIIDSMSDREVEAFLKDWRVMARNDQLPPDGRWKSWTIKCGRGWGKTKTAVEVITDLVERGEVSRLCLLGQGADDVRDVMVEGQSGFLACSKSWNRPRWAPSRGGGQLEWPNGAIGKVYSAEDPEALRGPEFDFAWIDEIMAFKAEARAKAESNLRFGLRLPGPLNIGPRRIYTTTPKPHKWLRLHLARINPAKGIFLTEGSTFDNAANLAGSFLEGIRDDYQGTRLGQQELMGVVLSDTENALWTSEGLDELRIMHDARVGPMEMEQRIRNFAKSLDVIIVAVDPNMTASGTSHAAGITVMGMKEDKRYLLADYSLRGAGPAQWGRRVVQAYQDWDANEVVAEVNQGGDLVKYVVDQMADSAGIDVPVVKVHATRGKQKRAEPVAAAYERGKVVHVGPAERYTLLETQMCDLHEAHDSTGEDFDRCDSLVWGMTRLARKHAQLFNVGGSGIFPFSEFLN